MRGTLLGTAVFLPPLASALTVLAYVGDVRLGLFGGEPLRGALVVSVVVWVVGSALLVPFAGVAAANAKSYALLLPRIRALRCYLTEHPSEKACAEPYGTVAAAVAWLMTNVTLERKDLPAASGPVQDLGARWTAQWIRGTAYLSAWRWLHRAEEAQIAGAATSVLVGDAKNDYLRLKGSDIANKDELTANLAAAVARLDRAALPFFPASVASEASRRLDDAPPEEALQERDNARAVLTTVRRAINDYRDKQHEGVINARNELVVLATAAGAVGYLLLLLAIVAGATKAGVVSAAMFFLVGGVVGLLARLGNRGDSSVDDYGLSFAKFVTTPISSGLAGVGGVVVAAFLGEAFGAGSTSQTVQLSSIFDVTARAGGILAAAIFGVSPNLLTDTLLEKADLYKANIGKSTAADGGSQR